MMGRRRVWAGRGWNLAGEVRLLMYAGGGDMWTMSGDWGLGSCKGAKGMVGT